MMSLSIDQPVSYTSIRHLASIAEEKTEGVALNPPAEELLTREDQEKLNFPDIRTFLRHMKRHQKRYTIPS